MNVVLNYGNKILDYIEFGECFVFECECYMLIDSAPTIIGSAKAVNLKNGHVVDLDLQATVFKVNEVNLCN